MKYEYEDVHMLFKKMAINTKEMLFTMKQIEALLHDPGFQVKLKTFSRDEVELLERLLALYKKYASELNKMEL